MSAFDSKRTSASPAVARHFSLVVRSQSARLRALIGRGPHGGTHATARVHHAAWRRRGGLAARGTRARPTGKTHRHTHSPGRGGEQKPHRSVATGPQLEPARSNPIGEKTGFLRLQTQMAQSPERRPVPTAGPLPWYGREKFSRPCRPRLSAPQEPCLR